MHSAYFDTHFHQPDCFSDWPRCFAIITAYATTGEQWTQVENAQADEALESLLREQQLWYIRLIGFLPSTGHAEPGWAVDVDLETALQLGRRFRQDAIYYVNDDALLVAACFTSEEPVLVGSFRSRVHTHVPGT